MTKKVDGKFLSGLSEYSKKTFGETINEKDINAELTAKIIESRERDKKGKNPLSKLPGSFKV